MGSQGISDLSPDNRIEGGTDSTEIGNENDQLKVALKDDVHNKDIGFSAFGLLKAVPETIIGDYRFNEDSNEDDFTLTSVGTSAYTVEAGGTGARLTVNASSDSAKMLSKRTHFYQSGRGIILKQSIILGDSGVAGCKREWGLKNTDEDNGTFLRLDGTTLSWVILRDGNETVINASAWDIPQTIDGNGHIWYIQYEWLGVGNMYLYCDEQLVHTYNFIGTSTEFAMGTPDLNIYYYIENDTNNDVRYMKMGCASIATEGNPNAARLDQNPQSTDLAIINKAQLIGQDPDDATAYTASCVSDGNLHVTNTPSVEESKMLWRIESVLNKLLDEQKKQTHYLAMLLDEDEDMEDWSL